MAAITRRWSTVLNGSLQDEVAFRKEADSIFAYLRKGPKPGATAVEVNDAARATRDIEQTMGMMPTFLRHYPPAALAGAWNEMKTVQLSSNTAIPNKYKELIGAAIAAQIPCKYCEYFHTEAAKLNGATQAEIDEAIAEAGSTRHWSTLM